MTTTSTNGRVPRKSLATQIDRLDLILDGFADGLNEAVAAAVQATVRDAVEATLRELLTNAELLRRLKPVAIPVRPSVAGRLWRGLVSAAKGCWDQAVALVSRVRNQVSRSATELAAGGRALSVQARRGMTAFGRRVWLAAVMTAVMAARFRKPLVIALGVGVSIGLGCYFAGPLVASMTSGMAGFVGSLAACAVKRLRQLAGRIELLDG
jgi:hypothetical protein